MNSSSLPSNPFRARNKSLLMAHRGAPTECPENTLSSFRRAFELGADVLEMDVRRTSDGHLVVCHDDKLDITTNGSGKIHETRFAAVRALQVRAPGKDKTTFVSERIPTFQEVLQALPEAAFNVDLKDVKPEDVDTAFQTIRDVYRGASSPPRLLLTSASAVTQKRIVELNRGEVSLGMGERAVYGALLGAYFGRKLDPKYHGRSCQLPLYAHYLGVRVPIVTQRVLNYLKKHDVTVHVWMDEDGSIDDPKLVEKWAARGVDGFFTDKIGEMIAAVKR